ncbi:MAG: lysophospholipid acyltransferase family protein [bacterium]
MKQKVLNFIIPLLVYLIAKLVNKTLRLKVIGEDNVKRLKQEGKKMIYAFWHGRQFMLVPYMGNRQIAAMTSLSREGEYHSKILKRFGYRVHRGSYTRGGVRGLLGLIKEIRAGYDTGFAVDGPTGPIYEPKEGIIFLAKKEDGYIVPLTASAKKKWIFKKAWDKFQLPYPFTQGIIIFGNPYHVSKEKDTKQECKKLKEKLDAITKKAEEFYI